MNVDAPVLREVAGEMYRQLKNISRERLGTVLSVQEYYGFGKARLPKNFVNEAVSPYEIQPWNIQAEIVRVSTDLTKEIHFHNYAHAHCIVLGEETNLDAPLAAYSLTYTVEDGKSPSELDAVQIRSLQTCLQVSELWKPLKEGQEITIPPMTLHGFTVDVSKDGILWLLSVQSPPVDGKKRDDYYRLYTMGG